jgi:hypothetical protein
MLWKIFGNDFNINHLEIAKQIALLLNNNNNLFIKYNAYKIMHNEIKYKVIIAGNCVISVIGLHGNILRHFCINSLFRRLGIGSFLLSSFESGTKMFIKNTNYKCLSIALKTDYRIIQYIHKTKLFLLEKR